jgi:hypothetical protein
VPTFTSTTGTGNFVRADSPALTGNPTAPTPAVADNDTSIATTAFVTAAIGAIPAGSSVMVSSTPPVGAPDNTLWWEDDTAALYIRYNDGSSTQWASVVGPQGPIGPTGPAADTSALAPKASPVFTGDPQAPTPATSDNDTSIATTAFVKAQYLQNSVVFDPPSQATNIVGAIQTLTVTGAAVGDFCLASFSVDLNGMTLLAWVMPPTPPSFSFRTRPPDARFGFRHRALRSVEAMSDTPHSADSLCPARWRCVTLP